MRKVINLHATACWIEDPYLNDRTRKTRMPAIGTTENYGVSINRLKTAQTRQSRLNSNKLKMQSKETIPFHQKSYVCIHVFENVKPVLLVSREHGDWCFLCGDDHPEDSSFYRVVGIGHLLSRHPDLVEVMDLLPDEEAERSTVGEQWIRTNLNSVQ
jgi:hypothetical protein